MILGIIQARMSSTRLPGKVLADVAGVPMLGRQVERLRRSRRMDELVLATSDQASDNAVADYAARLDLTVVRGPLEDVLGRFGLALEAFPEAATVVRMTADCPLTDWRVLDAVIDHRAATRADYASNTPEVRTYPHGLDIEVMTAAALRTAVREAADPYEREHVTPFLYRNPRRFRTEFLSQSPSLAHLRWTVDHPEDLDFVRHVYGALYAENPDFAMAEIAALDRNSSSAT